MNGVFHRNMIVDTKAVDVERRVVPVVASSEAVDGHGEIVEQDWDLGRYVKNPVVLWNHNRIFQQDTLPIGRAENVRVENKGTPQAKLHADITMASEEANPKAQQVLLLFAEGVQRAISVGFRPRKIRREEVDGDEVVILSNNLLLEISATPIGSNPEALAEQRALELEHIQKALGEARAVVPYVGYPVITGTWDGRAAERRIRAWAGGEDNISWAKYRRGFAWYDSANPEAFGSYKLPHHDVMDGDLKTHRGGVIAAGNALQGGRGGVDVPEADKAGLRSHLARHYRQFDMQAPWERGANAVHCVRCSAESELADSGDSLGLATLVGHLCKSCLDEATERASCFADPDSTSPPRGDETNTPHGEAEMADNPEVQAALEKLKAEHAVLQSKHDELEAKLNEASGTIEDATARLEAYEKQNKRLEEERDAAITRAEKAEAKIDEAEVDELIGKKLAPSEKDWALKLKRSQPELFAEMIEQRADMNLIGDKGEAKRLLDGNQPALDPEDPSKAAVDAVNAVAHGGIA